MRDHTLIEDGDHVLVGLSGGKDSMILLQVLVERQNAVPFNFKISAAHVAAEEIGYQIDREKLASFCDNLGIPLHYRTIEPDLEKDPSKAACFICSWHRRKVLFLLTKELMCNKLALGHHMDDVLETLFMNMVHHGEFSTMPPKLNMFDGKINLIRPLTLLQENELKKYARIRGLEETGIPCPFKDETRRKEMKKLVSEMARMHKRGRINLFRSMGNILEDYLP